ncbi:VQ motif-containing protein 22 [Salvia miltiorrhiza]|uniref:VQ motif-containing protein 22 n=1 Tax=Salvia miltiorrhiza TaxID=226208 RepID=UPI0025AB6E8A|nr:VQ motif-containing protein 22 [Salvia miltiorrhiza]
MSYPNNWMQLNFNDENQTNTLPTTTAAATAIDTAAIPRNAEQGRGARPIRRRSRASRRTPTTLLNTDTTNFRAMVQQFTGGPTAAANSAGMFDFTQQAPSNLYWGRGADRVQQQQQQQLQQRHMFMVGDVHGRGGGGGGGGHAPPESSSLNESRDYDGYML